MVPRDAGPIFGCALAVLKLVKVKYCTVEHQVTVALYLGITFHCSGSQYSTCVFHGRGGGRGGGKRPGKLVFYLLIL